MSWLYIVIYYRSFMDLVNSQRRKWTLGREPNQDVKKYDF